MVKRSRSRSHTKRRKSRRGGAWYNPMSWGQSANAPIVPGASDPLRPVGDAMTPPGVARENLGMTGTGGRSRRRGSRKTKRRRGGKYY